MSALLYCIGTQLCEIPDSTAVKLLRSGIPLVVGILKAHFSLVRRIDVILHSLC
jgi:hypothetical protein